DVPALKTVVIGMAWQLLSDQARSDASRLGALYCRYGDLARPGSIGIRGAGNVGEFVLAGGLHLYAQRDALRNRLLAELVPHYAQFVGDDNAARAGRQDESSGDLAYTYETFGRLLAQLRDQGLEVVVVAMPVPTPYD